MSSQLSKIRSVHTYVMPRTVYFGWICTSRFIHKNVKLKKLRINYFLLLVEMQPVFLESFLFLGPWILIYSGIFPPFPAGNLMQEIQIYHFVLIIYMTAAEFPNVFGSWFQESPWNCEWVAFEINWNFLSREIIQGIDFRSDFNLYWIVIKALVSAAHLRGARSARSWLTSASESATIFQFHERERKFALIFCSHQSPWIILIFI